MSLLFFAIYCIKYHNFIKFLNVEILWKCSVSAEFCEIATKLCGNCPFLQNFCTGKLGEITVLYAVKITSKYFPVEENLLLVRYSFCIEKQDKHVYNGKPFKQHIS